LGVSESNGNVRHELDFFKVASGLSLEFDQKSVNAEKLNVVKVSLPEGMHELSPQNQSKY